VRNRLCAKGKNSQGPLAGRKALDTGLDAGVDQRLLGDIAIVVVDHDEREDRMDTCEGLDQTRSVQVVHLDPRGPLYLQLRGGILLGSAGDGGMGVAKGVIAYLSSKEDDFMLSRGKQTIDDLVGNL